MSGAVRAAAVIPNWNGAGRIERCLKSLRAQCTPFAEIIVVDNGSRDGSPEAAERAGAHVMRFAENRGFAAAVNAGIRECRAEHIAIINNDVELHPEWLAHLLAALDQHPECGMVTGRTLMRDSQQVVDGVGDALSLGFAAARLGYGKHDGASFREARPVLAVSGAASLFRRDVFERAGGFEEAFFAYLEDVDFCLRAQLAGFQARYVPEATALHEVSASTGGSARMHSRVAAWMTAHQLLIAARFARGGVLAELGPRIAVTQMLWAALMLSRGHLLAWLRGLGIAAGRFRRVRQWQLGPGGEAQLLELLRWSEAQILADRDGSETFWRVYFGLFPR